MFFKFYGRVKNDRFVGHSSIKTHKWNALYWKSNWLQKLKEREQSELFKSCNIESASNFVFVSRKFLLAIENQWPLDLTNSYHDLFQRQTRQKNEGKADFLPHALSFAWHRLPGPKLGKIKERWKNLYRELKSLHYHNVTHRSEKY